MRRLEILGHKLKIRGLSIGRLASIYGGLSFVGIKLNPGLASALHQVWHLKQEWRLVEYPANVLATGHDRA